MTEDLSKFFEVVSKEKHRQNEEIKDLIGDLDSIFEKFSSSYSKKKTKATKKKKSQPVVVEETSTNVENLLLEKSLGLLSEPSSVRQKEDPITPLDQNFVTIDQLQKHYKDFISRVQQQLSTLGGGGETNLTYMDVPVTYVTSSNYFVSHKDYYIGINYAGAVTITLPYAEREGKIFIVKDELGEASKGTNRYITILPSGNDLIDGRDRAILAFDYGSLTFIWRGNSWRVV